MAITAQWVFTASMDVDPDKEALFNEVYDQEHAPALARVPGVLSVTRLKLDTLRVSIGGETKTIEPQGAPRYAAIFELENPDVLIGVAWAKAVEEGRWPEQVRPYTRNRQHTLHKVIK
jgi:hypothetical protein